jgi:hypothetical protein
MQFQAYFGVSAVPMIEGFIEYLKSFGMNVQLAPAIAFGLSIIWNLFLGLFFLHVDVSSALYAGMTTALLVVGYHEVSTPSSK